MMRRLMKMLGWLVFVAVLSTAGWGGWTWWRYRNEPIVRDGARVVVDVPKSGSGRTLSQVLDAAGLHVDDRVLKVIWRLRGDGARVRAGHYELNGPMTLATVLDEFVTGQPDRQAQVTIVAGWSMRQVREMLAQAPNLQHDSAALDDEALARRLGVPQGPIEGWLAPDTYAHAEGGSELDLLQRAVKLQQQRLDAAWKAHATELKLASPYDLLVLASVVEKETGREEDRTKVSAVFNNRLRVGMMLQSDPTVIYGMGTRFDGNLRRKDLRADTPYNSYTRTGLPPTPIAMPSQASLQAAGAPAPIKALYFVARGDGTSEFSESLEAHNRAVQQHQLRRQAGAGSPSASSNTPPATTTPAAPASATTPSPKDAPR